MVPILKKRDSFVWLPTQIAPIVILVFLFVRTPVALKIDIPSVIGLRDERLQFFGNISKDCTSGNCDKRLNRQALLIMQRFMNLESNPCTNFYEYSCGNWNKFTNQSSLLDIVTRSYEKKFDTIFTRWQIEENNKVLQPENIVQKKLVTYYKSCRMNKESALPNKYLQHMREEENLWQFGQTTDLFIALGKLGRYGVNSIFIEYDIKVTSNKVQLILSPQDSEKHLGWTEGIYTALKEYTQKGNEELQKELENFESNLFKAREDSSENDISDGSETNISAFVSRFLKALKAEEENGDDEEYVEMSVAQLMADPENQFDWKVFLSNLLNRPVRLDERIIVYEFTAIKRIAAFLSRSNTETIQLYTMARFLQRIIETAPGNANGDIYDCISHMGLILPVLMNYAYDMEYYSKIRKASNAVIHHIFESLRNEFKLILKENSMRLKRPDLESLFDRINNMRLIVGELPENASSIDYYNYANQLELREDNFAWNHLQALRIFVEHTLYPVGKEIINDANHFHIYHIDRRGLEDALLFPTYSRETNTVALPFACLQLPFYNEKFWDIMLYGELANTLGHEIMHGFDSEALEFDNDGVYLRRNTIRSNPQYIANIACLQNGTEHMPERIADVSGIQLVMRAFKKQITNTRDSTRFFFIKFAQYFCEPKTISDKSPDDAHDINHLRVNYVVTNLPEFAESFGCPKGKPMNPKKRCHLW